MVSLTKKQRVRAALAGEPVDRPPVSLWGHDYLRELRPRDLVAATLDAYREGDWDFIKLNPRATYFAEAWGNRYERSAAAPRPRTATIRIGNAEQLAGVSPVGARQGVFAEHLYALRLLVDEVGAEVDVIHTVFSPLAVVAQLCGPEAALLRYAQESPARAHAALAAVATTLSDYVHAALEAGASGIFFAPLAWASRDTCDESFYREFGRPYDLQVLAAAAGAPFNVLHVCRNHNMLDLLLDYPVAAFNWFVQGEGNPGLPDVRAQTSAAVMGGLDQARLHQMALDEVAAQARAGVSSVTGGMLLTAGCSIRPETPAVVRRTLRALVEAGV